MKYNTVIFDLDGTLLDTLADLADSTNAALEIFGFPTHSYDSVRMFVGNGVRNLMIRALPDGEGNPKFEECLETFRAHYAKNCRNKTQAYEGIYPMLAELKARGIKMAIVSNKFDAAVKTLNRDYFGEYIDIAIGERAEIRKKPAPDTVLQALRELDSSADEAVYVGDSDVDVATAVNSGMACIGVSWGFRGRDFLAAHGAKTIVDTPAELLQVLLS